MTETIGEPWGLSVFGAGSVRVEPQLVRVKLSVDVLEPLPDKAFQEAGAAVARLREVLRGLGIPDASVSGSRAPAPGAVAAARRPLTASR
ncbi:SIMPL domain-containing protein [Streptomyces sp. NRRL S-646]|uniref:SIMPL domain-containing protein n=1 Tax=Streptomyces sp. NRRL S-646 TaxID=1463917 RepID=UPI0004C68CD8|nr:SIMPL domain-containing protein [Streptomyces sp. NRRL S-646]